MAVGKNENYLSTKPHIPPEQKVPPVQTFPHDPQLLSSVFRSTHISLPLKGHAVWNFGQEAVAGAVQTPDTQVWPPEQETPHPPQL
jgi:hypothetical protein